MTQPKPITDNKELRNWVEQEVNNIFVGADHTQLPKTMGVLIPSLNLQRTIDRITEHIQNLIKAARVNKNIEMPSPKQIIKLKSELRKANGNTMLFTQPQIYIDGFMDGFLYYKDRLATLNSESETSK